MFAVLNDFRSKDSRGLDGDGLKVQLPAGSKMLYSNIENRGEARCTLNTHAQKMELNGIIRNEVIEWITRRRMNPMLREEC